MCRNYEANISKKNGKAESENEICSKDWKLGCFMLALSSFKSKYESLENTLRSWTYNHGPTIMDIKSLIYAKYGQKVLFRERTKRA